MDLDLPTHSVLTTDSCLLPNLHSYSLLILPHRLPSRRKLPFISVRHDEFKLAISQGKPHCTPDLIIHLPYSFSANTCTSTASTAAA